MKLIKLLMLIFLVITINSCHEDINDESITKTPTPSPTIVKEISGSILGYVYDENNQPVENANVKLYSSTSTTDKYGMYSFNNVKLDKLGTYIKVEKSGYIFGSDMIYPDKGLNVSYIHMYHLDKTGEFKAEDGGTINIQGGTELVFSPNTIVKEDGSLYSGNVSITAKFLNPFEDKIEDKMPGALRGIATNGNTAILGTMGMIAVELRDIAGNELNLKQGSTASVSIPVNDNQVNNAPQEIPMWYFDENIGLWKEEGKALLQDGKYISDLAHFSWWNLDAKFDPIYMCVKILFDNGKPASGYIVSLTADVIFPTTYGWTTDDGIICGLVPKNKEMVLKVRSPFCQKPLIVKNIGPFDNDVTLDDIILNSSNKLGKGQVVCNGDPEKNARVLLNIKTSLGERTLIITTDEEGKFDFNYIMTNCENILSANVFAYNPNTGDASSKIEIDLNAQNDNLEINICNNCDFTVEIKPEYGIMCDISTLSLKAVVTGAGNYSYLWSNGETGTAIDNLESNLYCVTVTETNAGCDAVKCYQYYPRSLEFNDSINERINPYCGLDNGSFYFFVSGSLKPSTSTINGPNGYSYTTDLSEFKLSNLEAGTYRAHVIDAGGCSVSKDFILENDKNHEVEIRYSNGQGCDSTFIHATVKNVVDYNNLKYKWSTGQEGYEIIVYSSGNYCVTVSEGNGCDIETCADIIVNDPVEHPVLSNCDKNLFDFKVDAPVSIFFNNNNNTFNNDFTIDVLQDGYGFGFYYEGYNCGEIEGEIDIPHLVNGLSIDSVARTTCPTCNDGKIFYTVSTSSNCIECEIGDVAIYSINDLNLDTDLFSDNDAGTLVSGKYYVAVKDKTSGCLIAHEIVNISMETQSDCLSADLKQGIVAYYPFSNGSTKDFSGNNYDLKNNGFNIPLPTSDRAGNPNCAYMFKFGIEPDFLFLEDTVGLNSIKDYTISLWYQPLGDRDAGLFEGLFERIENQQTQLSLGLYDCRKAVFTWTSSVWDDDNVFGCNEAIINHDWHHLVATYNSTSNEMKLYRNGVLMGTKNQYNNNTMMLGFLYLGKYFNGKIDDVIFYNRTLKQEDVKELLSIGTCCL